MIHNPDYRSCDSGRDSEKGDIQISDLLYVPIFSFFGSGNPNGPDRKRVLHALRSGGKSGVSKPGVMCGFPLVYSGGSITI
jgi:hypothetical protein